MTVASPTAVASTGKEFVAQPDQQSKQDDAEERTAGNQFFLHVYERFRLHLQKSDTNGKSFLTEDQYVQESERAGAGTARGRLVPENRLARDRTRGRGYVFSVAAGILPAVEPGILLGGMSERFQKTLPLRTAGPGGKMPPSTAAKMAAATDVNPTLNTYGRGRPRPNLKRALDQISSSRENQLRCSWLCS